MDAAGNDPLLGDELLQAKRINTPTTTSVKDMELRQLVNVHAPETRMRILAALASDAFTVSMFRDNLCGDLQQGPKHSVRNSVGLVPRKSFPPGLSSEIILDSTCSNPNTWWSMAFEQTRSNTGSCTGNACASA
jgi:hypothetical protein